MRSSKLYAHSGHLLYAPCKVVPLRFGQQQAWAGPHTLDHVRVFILLVKMLGLSCRLYQAQAESPMECLHSNHVKVTIVAVQLMWKGQGKPPLKHSWICPGRDS